MPLESQTLLEPVDPYAGVELTREVKKSLPGTDRLLLFATGAKLQVNRIVEIGRTCDRVKAMVVLVCARSGGTKTVIADLPAEKLKPVDGTELGGV